MNLANCTGSESSARSTSSALAKKPHVPSISADSKILIVGAGSSGKAAYELCSFLQERGGIYAFELWDPHKDISAEDERLDLAEQLSFEHYTIGVLSPGISPFSQEYAQAKSLCDELISEVELAWRIYPRPDRWLAITGTNGKTTTTALTTHIFEHSNRRVCAVGNIGKACSKAILEYLQDCERACKEGQKASSQNPASQEDISIQAPPAQKTSIQKLLEFARNSDEAPYLVAELSSFQLFLCSSFNPCAAALLNISPDHLEWHKSHQHYCASKFKLFKDAPSTRSLILREQELQDYPNLAHSLAHSFAATCVLLKENTQTSKAAMQESSSSGYAYVQEQDLYLECSGEMCKLSSAASLKIKGRHNLENCLMASYLAYSCGLSIEEIREAITSFTALEHRIEFVAQIDSCSFYNDSKATNIDAATQALGAFDDKPLIILLGGHDKGADLSAFAARVLARCKAAICFGEACELFHAALSKAQPEQLQSKACKLIKASNLKEAFDLSLKELAAGDCVVLSPACSSYDEFNNYQERGRFFKSLVLEKAQKGGE